MVAGEQYEGSKKGAASFYIAICGCVFAIVSIIANYGCTPGEGEAVIGVVLPATGQYSRIGELVREGVALAESELKQESKGGVVAFRYADTEGKPATARRAFLDLVDRRGAVAVLGSILTSDTKGFVEELDRLKVPVLANGSSAPELRGISEYFFRNWPADDYEGYGMGRFARNSLKLSKLGALVADDPYPRGLFNAFESTFTADGGEIVVMDMYDPGFTNFDAVVRRILGEDPEGIYIVGFPSELATIVKRIRALDEEVQILSAVGIDAPEFFQATGAAAEGIFYTAPVVTEGSLPYLKFRQAFEHKYGKEPEIAAAISYDAAMLLGRACQDTDCTSEGIYRWLRAVSDYEGASGLTAFDEQGDVVKPIAIKRIENGETVVVSTIRRRI